MRKELPIMMNPMVESECSVFEKLAIIQTSPHGEAWLCLLYTSGGEPLAIGAAGREPVHVHHHESDPP